MTRSAASLPHARLASVGAMICGGTALLAVLLLLTYLLSGDRGEILTRNTVRLSLAWYALALSLMMQLHGPADWSAATATGRLARWCWTWAVVVFLVHLAMAFHYYHGWSHTHAFERTREVSGVGEGIFISYFFTLWWTADMCWWWWQPAKYAARSVWIDRVLHTFMLFIVFNGMVIFETGAIRWAGLIMFATLATVWFASRRLRTTWAT